jgi:hypothetical protein
MEKNTMALSEVSGLSSSANFQTSGTLAASSTEAILKNRRDKVALLQQSPYETTASNVKTDDAAPRFEARPDSNLKSLLSAV